MDYPDGAVYPVFHRLGFRLYAVDRTVSLSPGILARFEGSGLVRPTCSPDLVLVNDVCKYCAFVECKASSFGPETRQAVQARTLLLIETRGLSRTYGLDVHRSSVLYVLPAEEVSLQEICLEGLAIEIRNAGLTTLPWQVWGLSMEADGFYLVNMQLENWWAGNPGVSTETAMEMASTAVNDAVVAGKVRIVQTSDPEGYDVLRFIPVDPSVNLRDEVGMKILEERIRSNFVSTVMSGVLSEDDVMISIDGLCRAVIPFVWDLWSETSRKSVRTLIRRSILGLLRKLESHGAMTATHREGYRLVFPDESSRVRVHRFLLGAQYRKGRLLETTPQDPLPLFESEEQTSLGESTT